jgi:hypothetical protein
MLRCYQVQPSQILQVCSLKCPLHKLITRALATTSPTLVYSVLPTTPSRGLPTAVNKVPIDTKPKGLLPSSRKGHKWNSSLIKVLKDWWSVFRHGNFMFFAYFHVERHSCKENFGLSPQRSETGGSMNRARLRFVICTPRDDICSSSGAGKRYKIFRP